MIDRVSLRLSIAAAAMLAFAGPAASSTVAIGSSDLKSEIVATNPLISEQSTVVYLKDTGGGALELRGWSNFAAVGTVNSETVRVEVRVDNMNGGLGFVPGLDARVLVPLPSGWQFLDSYIAGKPVLSVVGPKRIETYFRNDYPVSSFGQVAPYGRFIRLSFFRPEGWVEALDGDEDNFVLEGNARVEGVNGIPLPGGGPLLASAVLCAFAARRWVFKPR